MRYLVLACAIAALACSGDSNDVVQVQGSIRIAVTTVGRGVIPGGYQVQLDHKSPVSIGSSATITMSNVGVGAHSVQLLGIAGQCTADWYAPQSVTVSPDSVPTVTYHVRCDIPLTGSIVFSSDQDNRLLDIYVMLADGSQRRRLTTTFDGADQPKVSPGGTRIAFISSGHLMVMNVDGSQPMQLTNSNGEDGGLDWSPDGTHLVFVRGTLGYAAQLMTITAVGRRDSVLFAGSVSNPLLGAPESPAAWSPDSVHIAFWDNEELDVVDLRSGRMQNVRPPDNGGFARNPVWSPDGTKIAFVVNHDIGIINAQGGNETRIEPPIGEVLGMTWSKDGQRLIFAGAQIGGIFDIYSVHVDGTGLVDLTNTPAWYEFRPSATP